MQAYRLSRTAYFSAGAVDLHHDRQAGMLGGLLDDTIIVATYFFNYILLDLTPIYFLFYYLEANRV